MSADDLAALRRKWSSAKSAVKAAEKRRDFAYANLRFDAQNRANTLLRGAQHREAQLRKRVEALTQALKETP